METRVAVLSMIVGSNGDTDALNHILHEYSPYIIGRMGIPYREKQISIISVAVDAPQETITALSAKLDALSGISVKTSYSTLQG